MFTLLLICTTTVAYLRTVLCTLCTYRCSTGFRYYTSSSTCNLTLFAILVVAAYFTCTRWLVSLALGSRSRTFSTSSCSCYRCCFYFGLCGFVSVCCRCALRCLWIVLCSIIEFCSSCCYTMSFAIIDSSTGFMCWSPFLCRQHRFQWDRSRLQRPLLRAWWSASFIMCM